jgi:molecular chaperone GrpE
MGSKDNSVKNEMANPEVDDGGQKQEQVISAESSDKVAELELKVAELNDKYLRLYSEFDNYRKRTAKEKMEFILTSGQEVFKLVLPLLDDFERAIKLNSTINEIEHVKEGFSLIYTKFVNSLTQKGLVQMDAMGATFDPDLHEAITNIPSPGPEMKGKVLDVVEKGYSLNGKVIRFAKVIVGN